MQTQTTPLRLRSGMSYITLASSNHAGGPRAGEMGGGLAGTLAVGHPHCPLVRAISADLPLLHLGASQISTLPPFADAHRRHPVRLLLAAM